MVFYPIQTLVKAGITEVIVEALALAEDFADGGPFAVILGNNTTSAGTILQKEANWRSRMSSLI